MVVGSLGYIVSLSTVALGFYNAMSPSFMLIFLLGFIATHAIGQGGVIWVYISEIFPIQIRAAGQTFGAAVDWIFVALITHITPVFLGSGGRNISRQSLAYLCFLRRVNDPTVAVCAFY